MRFRLRTLLFVLALGPPVLAGACWVGLWTFHKTPAEQISPESLIGKTRSEVVTVLGPPEDRQPDRWLYWAGTNVIDDLWLEIDFRNDRVVTARRRPD